MDIKHTNLVVWLLYEFRIYALMITQENYSIRRMRKESRQLLAAGVGHIRVGHQKQLTVLTVSSVTVP